MARSAPAGWRWPQAHAVRAARHLLTARTPDRPHPPDLVAERVAGLQAQVNRVPALSVLARGGAAGVDSGWSNLVRTWAMRGTLHLVPATEIAHYAAALGDSIAARETRLWPRQGVEASAEDRLNDAMIQALRAGPLGRRELAKQVGALLGATYRTLLEHPWGIGLKPAVARGLLRLKGSGTEITLSLPPTPPAPIEAVAAQRWLAGKYLAANAFGTPAAFAAWSGLPAAAARRALAAADEGPVTIEGTAYAHAGPLDAGIEDDHLTLLPEFDPYLLAVADKDGFCGEDRTLLYRKGGWVSATVLRAGLPIGTWKLRDRRSGRIEFAPMTAWSAALRRRVEQQAGRFTDFLTTERT